MSGHPVTIDQIWSTFQEPRCPSYSSTGYMLLLSAIDNGWQVQDIELTPSWDQHGFIYLVTLTKPFSHIHQQLILPKTADVECLLMEQARREEEFSDQNYHTILT
jgi:hypothetical protein